ncbi:MAG: hypothetical protein HP491_09125 [Nitrospira sp.]|nr:hypothetical protein [Nitrospira sp.]MBH0180964.1 hypothetical protein [Nitrospira sp.]MBH0186506.1 hypothetical protein [Nitrospira sp.]
MWLNAVVRRLRNHFAVVALAVCSAVIPIGCDNRETILLIEKPTEVLSIEQAPSSSESANTSVQPGKVIATLKAGETARAIGVYHGTDHDAFHVKLADGTEGLILAGDTFKVTSR